MSHYKFPLLISIGTAMSLVLSACGGKTSTKDDEDFFVPATKGTVTEDAFDRERLLQISLQMPANDFLRLRSEGRPLNQTLGACQSSDFEYSDFKAVANIDGQRLENVAIRKKGYLGSLSRIRPSIKLNFDTHQKGRTFKTLKRMTLNNDRQDPSHTHQCMAYDLFRAAGLVAPRCNLAQVYINGENLGIYSHVESIKKPFLERSFGNKSGNLYEAQVADFGSQLNQRFELKTNKKINNRSDLDDLANVLTLNDDQFLDQISQHINIDEFIKFWAVETLIGHWDSATGNTNNYYMYHNPDDDLFHFIPWGTDSTFTKGHTFKPDSAPLYKNFSLAKRFYDIEQTRNQYFATINTLLTENWVEEDLIKQVEKIQQLTLSSKDNYNQVTEFIKGSDELGVKSQRTLLTSAINGEVNQTAYILPDQVINCSNDTTSLTAEFSSEGDQGSFSFTDAQGIRRTASMTIVSNYTSVDSLAYKLDQTTAPAVVGLTFIGAATPPYYPDSYVLQVFVEKPDYKVGQMSLQGISTNIMLFKVVDKDSTPAKIELISAGHSGSIKLSEAGIGAEGSIIKGSITAQMGLIKSIDYIKTDY